MKTIKVHINDIRAGDTILHDGKIVTVSNNNIHRDTFMGRSIFGDTYRLGTTPVKKVIANTLKQGINYESN